MPAAGVSRILKSSQVEGRFDADAEDDREGDLRQPWQEINGSYDIFTSQTKLYNWLDANTKDGRKGVFRQPLLLGVRDRFLRVEVAVDEKTHLQEKEGEADDVQTFKKAIFFTNCRWQIMTSILCTEFTSTIIANIQTVEKISELERKAKLFKNLNHKIQICKTYNVLAIATFFVVAEN